MVCIQVAYFAIGIFSKFPCATVFELFRADSRSSAQIRAVSRRFAQFRADSRSFAQIRASAQFRAFAPNSYCLFYSALLKISGEHFFAPHTFLHPHFLQYPKYTVFLCDVYNLSYNDVCVKLKVPSQKIIGDG